MEEPTMSLVRRLLGAERDPRVVAFLKESAGEVFVLLPLLDAGTEGGLDLDVDFVALDGGVLDTLKIDQGQRGELDRLGKRNFGLLAVLVLLLRLLTQPLRPTLLMTCFNGKSKFEDLFIAVLPRSVIVFYPHAYGLTSLADSPVREVWSKERHQRRYGKHAVLLLTSEHDVPAFVGQGWPQTDIHVVGTAGYRSTWLKRLGAFGGDERLHPDRPSVFVPLRGPHEQYLTEANYERMLRDLESVIRQRSDFDFFLKAHPRQRDIEALQRRFAVLPNATFTDENTLTSAARATVTVAFWSSAIQDSIAVRTPAIEFHRHEVAHDLLLTDARGELKSFYVHHSLCKSVSNRETLLDELDRVTSTPTEVLEVQRDRFDDVFHVKDATARTVVAFSAAADRATWNAPKVRSYRRSLRVSLAKSLVRRGAAAIRRS